MKLSPCSPFSPSRPSAGFTLIEILVVVAIISMLLVISGMGIGSSISSMQLSAAANGLGGTLNHAALLARRENRPVQVRFYKFGTVDRPAPQYRAYQLAMLEGINPDGTARIQLLSEVFQLPAGVIMVTEPEHNSIAGLNEQAPNPSDPSFGPSYTYTSYEIRPDGLTTLPKSVPNVITLVQESQKLESSGLPANYRSLVLNSLNARVKVY